MSVTNLALIVFAIGVVCVVFISWLLLKDEVGK